MNKVNIDGYRRVQKRTAERLYKEGETIYLLPVNMRPTNYWQRPFAIRKDDHAPPYSTFSHRINAYAYYHCQTKAQGYYPAYYIRPSEGA